MPRLADVVQPWRLVLAYPARQTAQSQPRVGSLSTLKLYFIPSRPYAVVVNSVPIFSHLHNIKRSLPGGLDPYLAAAGHS
jgi:hypothetical protein